MPELSRGLRSSDTPGSRSSVNADPEGVAVTRLLPPGRWLASRADGCSGLGGPAGQHRSAAKSRDLGSALEKVTKEAVALPLHQRLALARFLIGMDDPVGDEDVQQAWDAEISGRVRAVRQGRTEGIPYRQVLARLGRRLRP
ncbi:MAG: addiction module protein [Verrucomicrobiota bacterium]